MLLTDAKSLTSKKLKADLRSVSMGLSEFKSAYCLMCQSGSEGVKAT